MLHFLGPNVLGLLGSGGAILSWVSLCFCGGIYASEFCLIQILGVYTVDTWSCLCWADVLFFGFYCFLWILVMCGACGLHDK